MIRTLFKYERKSYTRIIIPILLLMVGLATVTRINRFVYEGSGKGGSFFALGMNLLAVFGGIIFVTALVGVLVRYYKNLFGDEGYLSLTLPVTPHQHIMAKLLGGLFVFTAVVLTIILSWAIVTSGEYLLEVIKALAYWIRKVSSDAGAGHILLFIIEFIILTFATASGWLMLFQACICVGQLAKKRRIALAVGAFFIYIIVSQNVGMVFMMSFSELVMDLIRDLDKMGAPGWHIIFWGLIGIQVIRSVVCYFVQRFILSRKVNLE